MIHSLAFRIGESAYVADVEVLQRLQKEFAEWKIVVPNMAKYSGLRVRIRVADNVLGYEFEGVEGRWMEGSIVDPGFAHASIDCDSYICASEIYLATVATGDQRFVEVRDRRDCRYLCFRSNTPEEDAKTLNRIASMRCRLAFEHNFGFDGDYNL